MAEPLVSDDQQGIFMQDKPRLPAHAVYGVNIGVSPAARIMVLKFDLGTFRRTFHLNEDIVVHLLANLPSVTGHLLGIEEDPPPEIYTEDWDGHKTPSVVESNTMEFDDGLIMQFGLDRGPDCAFLLRRPAWRAFSDRLWQYQPYFSHDQQP